MSEIKIKRRARNVSITLSTSTSSATTLRMDDMSGAMVSLATMSTDASTLQLYGAESENGTYRRVYDASGNAADITLDPSTTEGRMYALPDAAFGLSWCKIVSGDTNSTGVAGIVTFKS